MSIIAKVTSCTCAACKMACTVCPCLPTPEDVEKLIDAGYKDRLMPTFVLDKKHPGIFLPTLAPIKEDHGCTFHDEEGLCELHDQGLKPLEGKLSHHNTPTDHINRAIAYSWISEQGIQIMEQFTDTADIVTLMRMMLPCVTKPGKIEQIQ